MQYTLKNLVDPEIFKVNTLEAHSDHKYYSDIASAKEGNFMDYKSSLNGEWSFSYSSCSALKIEGFYKEDFDISTWNTITVPSHIQLQGYDKPHYVNTMYPWDGHNKLIPPEIPKDYNPVGQYVKKIFIPDNWDKSSIYISLQGVESAFYLWINGNYIGYSEDSFTPSEFDISPFIKDGENTVAVEVHKWCSGSWLEDQDFWRFSGIFRDVYLYTKPKVHVNDIFIKTLLNDSFSTAYIKTKLKLEHSKSLQYFQSLLENNISVIQEIYDSKDILINATESNVYFNNDLKNISTNNFKTEVTLDLTINNPNLWSAEFPNLYTCYIILKNSDTDEIIEVIPQKIGIRKFEINDKIMKINGKRVVFKGVNRHEFSCYNGRVISEEEMLWDIKFLKANNFNAVRTSHYPNNSRWYELCDEYGLYVIDEANIETHGTWQKMGKCSPENAVPNDDEKWLNSIIDRGISMLERDKNHPSIVIWSCGNEAYGGRILYELSKWLKSRDKTRVIQYEGVFWDRRFNDTSDVESRMYAKVSEIEEYLNNNPAKPFISCEYSHAMGNSNGALHKYTELEDKYQLYQGGFIWDFIDQSLMKTAENGENYLAFGGDYDDRPTDYNFCVNGLVYGDRKPSPKMQEVKALFSDFKVKPTLDSVIIKNTSLFTNLNKYHVKWRVLRDGISICSGEPYIFDLQPLTTGEFKLPFALQGIVGEYIHEVSIVLKEDTLWAEQGHEISFGQYVYSITETNNPDFNNSLKNSDAKHLIEDCDINIGIKGDNFHHIFSRSYGSIVSMKYNNIEFLSLPILPNFWRAPTDNDRGNKMPFRYSQWKIASLYQKCVDIHLSKVDIDGILYACINYTYELPTSPIITCNLKYLINSTGEMIVELNYDGCNSLSEIPVFGISFKVPNKYSSMKWYGNGPEESYIDRKHGARLGIFNSTAKESISQYVIPQECGNKTEVRWLEVVDKEEIGLKFSAITPFECSVLPYTCHELESAAHLYDLNSNPNYTVININKIQMGVGGDDSWGACTHAEYLIPSNAPLNFTFKISYKN